MYTQETVSTYYADDKKGKAVVRMGPNGPYVEYYDGSGHLFFTEDYDNEPLPQVEAKAEDWANGYKQLNG